MYLCFEKEYIRDYVLEKEMYVLMIRKRKHMKLYFGKRSVCAYVLERKTYEPIFWKENCALMF